jgi:hypothetical protein
MNYTLRVGIAFECVEITLVSVIFTAIRVKVPLVCVEAHSRCKITLYLWKLEITLVCVEITLCVYKSLSSVS